MKNGILLVLLVALGACTAALAAVGRDPNAEKKRLNKADMALAAHGLLRRSDLTTGWAPTKPSDFDEGNDDAAPGCDPDRSRFTITGRAHSAFKHPAGSRLESEVDFFASNGAARDDFRTATSIDFVKCAKAAAAKEKTSPVRLRSATMLPAQGLGERAVWLRMLLSVPSGNRRVPVYFDFVAFQQGRAIGTLTVWNAQRPLADSLVLVRLMLARSPG